MKAIPTIVLLMSLFLMPYGAKSQIGLKLGVHSFDLNSPNNLVFPDSTTVSYSEAKLGFQGGIYGRLDLTKLFIETRVMLNSTKVEYVIDSEDELFEVIKSESFTNLDIPLVVGLNVAFLDFYGGPVAHLHLSSTSDLKDIKGFGSRFKAAEYGFRAGMGIELGDISVSLEYEGNFSKFGDHITIDGQDFDFGKRPSRLLLNLGLRIF